MLTTIPRKILRYAAVFSAPISFDRYQEADSEALTVHHVHLQSVNATHRTALNTEVTLRGILFVDARASTPALDFWELQTAAQAAGGQLTVTVTTRAGRELGPYTVESVDGLPDDEDNLHHWELGLV